MRKGWVWTEQVGHRDRQAARVRTDREHIYEVG